MFWVTVLDYQDEPYGGTLGPTLQYSSTWDPQLISIWVG